MENIFLAVAEFFFNFKFAWAGSGANPGSFDFLFIFSPLCHSATAPACYSIFLKFIIFGHKYFDEGNFSNSSSNPVGASNDTSPTW